MAKMRRLLILGTEAVAMHVSSFHLGFDAHLKLFA